MDWVASLEEKWAAEPMGYEQKPILGSPHFPFPPIGFPS